MQDGAVRQRASISQWDGIWMKLLLLLLLPPPPPPPPLLLVKLRHDGWYSVGENESFNDRKTSM
jgi:hypothetical protein